MYDNESKYELKNGVGIIKKNNNSYEYFNGEINGEVKYHLKDDFEYFEGKYLNGKKSGKSKEYQNGTLIFEGGYADGLKNGLGKEYFENGKIKFEGEYLSGKKNGLGKEYFNNGKIKFEGNYKNGKTWSGNGYSKDNNEIRRW